VKQAGPLVVGVAELLRRPGSTRDELREAVLEDLSTSTAVVPDGAPITVEVRLEAVNEGIVAKGTVSAPWTSECRRCLRPIESVLVADVLEVYEDSPVEGETSKLDHDRIDLEPLAREAVLLGLPLAPLCQDDCLGLCAECGADRNAGDCGHTVEVVDDRWSALSQITFDE
jgi:uncharacterized protein